MGKLDNILEIGDPDQRLDALVDYARSLNINVMEAQISPGRYSEERLVLLIFDACHNIKKAHASNFQFISTSVMAGTMVLVLLILLPRVLLAVRKQPVPTKPPPKTFKAYDSQGNPVVENRQPVLFELMDGVYQQFDKEGHLTAELVYKEGDLIRKREFNKKGELIKEREYLPEGPP